MRWRSRTLRPRRSITVPSWLVAMAFAFCDLSAARMPVTWAAERTTGEPLRVAVYDAAPYGSVGPDGLFSGISVDLWRRVAEQMHWDYRLTLVARMDDVLTGVERGRFDVAIGAVTITPERLARVDFSYPAHRSGVSVAFRKESGPIAALISYGTVLKDLGRLILVILIMLLVIGGLMWSFERPRRNVSHHLDSSVKSIHDGIYWAIVTMTTVGYGDKTPKTPGGRFLAVFWMLASLALVSLLSTSIVAQMTAERVDAAQVARENDLEGKRLAAAADSSGAEYLDELHLKYTKYGSLREALASLAADKSDAVVNSVGALEYSISARFSRQVAMPRGLLAPSFMAFALPMNSPLKKPLDAAMIPITESSDWRSVEESYFGK